MSSSSSSSSSSAALATVTVTARDIEFSNYNSVTGKWGGAVMTMMILDSVTEDLEGYNEKVYAVFRNHDDPTDLIEFSSEIDGLDTRVTTTDSMVPSAKYELYKIYGETSGGEYATSSQFYFQVPGKEWDFANDTVDHDIELVSDWFNYGYVVTSDDVVHGAPTQQDIINVASGDGSTEGATVTINGETILISDIVKYKMTSLVTGDTNNTILLRNYKNLQDFDVVSSKITLLYSGRGWTTFNKRFAFPETVQTLGYFFSKTYNFNQHVYLPDSVTKVYSFFGNGSANDKVGFTKKIHFPRNLTQRYGYSFNYLPNWAGSIKDLATNVQLPDSQETHTFAFGYAMDWGAGLENSTYTTPSSWTYVPTRVCNFGLSGNPDSYSGYNETPYKVVVSEGITAIHSGSMMNSRIIEIKLPSTLTSLQSGFLSGTGTTILSNNAGFIKIDMSACTNITQLPDNSFTASKINIGELKLPSSLTMIGNYFLTGGYVNGGHTSTVGYPTDADGAYYAVPNGVTTLGNHCCGNVAANAKKIILPSTITSVGTHFCYGSFNSTMQNPKIAVLEGISPDAFASSDYSFRSNQTYSQTAQGCWRIHVDPGTTDAWAAKFPDIERSDRPGYYWRHIEWVEKPTQYGYVFYRETSDGPEKYVELQSLAEFNSLCFTNYNQTVTVGEDQITLNNSAAPNMITGFSIGTEITSLPNNFGKNCRITKVYFQPSANTVTAGDSCFFNSGWDNNHTATINLNNRVTTIGNDFLNQHHYVSALKGFGGVTSVGGSFLTYNNLNLTFDTSNLVSVGSNFLHNCTNFNSQLDFSSLTTIGGSFFERCTSYNQPLSLPNVTSGQMGYFLYGCTSFNQPLDLSNATGIMYWSSFLSGCTSFNSAITFPSSVSGSGYKSASSFMWNCTSFNQPIDLSFLQSANQADILNDCTAFNSSITLPSSMRMYTLLGNCVNFNQPLTLPAHTESSGIYGSICKNLKSFNQPITIPSTLCRARWYNSATLFENCDSLTSTVTISSSTVPNGTDTAVIYKSFSTTDSTAPCYTTGVTFTGTGASAWKNVLPDYDGTQATPANIYRKINVV